MYASQTKRLCVRGSDETKVQQHQHQQPHRSSSGPNTSLASSRSQQLPSSQPQRSVCSSATMTTSAAGLAGHLSESTPAMTSALSPSQPSQSYQAPINEEAAPTNKVQLASHHVNAQELIGRLANETTEETKTELILSIRNLITACNRKKDALICDPNFNKVLNLIDDDKSSSTVKTQLALLICSVAKSGEHNVRSLSESLVDDKIFNLTLSANDETLIEACLRCLRSMMSWPQVARTSILYENQAKPINNNNNREIPSKDLSLSENSLGKVIAYARNCNSFIAQECVADIFARTCNRYKDQVLLQRAAAVPCIVHLLESPSTKVVIASLNWLTQLSLKNHSASLEVVSTKCASGKPVLDRLVELMSKDKLCVLQFLSARCFAHIYRALEDNDLKKDSRVVTHVLPTLVRMVHPGKPSHLRIKSAECLAHLIECETRLQNIASVCDHLIDSLANMLDHEHNSAYQEPKNRSSRPSRVDDRGNGLRSFYVIPQLTPPPSLQQTNMDSEQLQSIGSQLDYNLHTDDTSSSIEMRRAAFLALAALASNLEPIRKRIFDTCSVMHNLVRSLNGGDTQTLEAVLTCLLSLSRSVQQLRTNFNENSVYSALKNLLTTKSNDVLILVLAILCNISLDFSPGKQHFLDTKVIEILCNLTRGHDPLLRLHAMWALMNMVYQLKDQSLKFQILRTLGVDHVLSLLEIEDDEELVLKTLGFLRNLLSQKLHIDAIMSSHGESIMQALIQLLNRAVGVRIKEQALCVLTNIADGTESKLIIMNNRVMLSYLASTICDEQSGDLRLAAICCITNLAHKGIDGADERRDEMNKFGIEEKLKSMLNTSDPILSDRVRTAYNQFVTAMKLQT